MKRHRLPLHNNKWIRRLHAWCGFFTLLLMLLYGITGLWLSHRAVWPLPGPHTSKSEAQLLLTEPLNSVDAFQAQLFTQWGHRDWTIRETTAQYLPTPEQPLLIPARWEARSTTATETYSAQYVPGTLLIQTQQQHANWAAVLNRLHRGMGTGIGWQLFSDLAALAMLLLALTSLLMWTKLHGSPKRAGWLLIAGVIATGCFAAFG
ncbi:PepSY-associated TM helix domain-containing protein [Vibrio mimicus]|uniref:PepSY-associated TM helix domain-containing protein n=1 Tax=Vibrio mimicus TaxID=674 RepID=UPI002F94DE8D